MSAAVDGVKALVKGRRPAESSAAAVAELGMIASRIDRAAPAEAPAFRTFLMDTATRVAEASTEGGFLGFGAQRTAQS